MQAAGTPYQRLIFIDNLRAFVFVLLAFDHVSHAYALHFGRFHFFKDIDRSIIGDIFYLFDNSIIMPLLFFITGLFVLPAVQQKGMVGFCKDRLFRLGIPYIIGIPLIVPLLVYPRYCYQENPDCGYSDFWINVYFNDKLQGGGPFWVLFCLALYSFILITIVWSLPLIKTWFVALLHSMIRRPIVSIILFIIISMVILTLSDYRWGAPWWIGISAFDNDQQPIIHIINKIIGLFHLQGSRFLIHGLYFLTGAIISMADRQAQNNLWTALAQQWRWWLLGMLIVGTAYIGFTLSCVDQGTYTNDIYRHFYGGGGWSDSLPFIQQYGGLVTIRTCLHGIFIFLQVTTLLSLFYQRFNRSTPFWCNLSSSTYGIFLLHEVPVIWLQYKLNGIDLPIAVKIISIFVLGIGGTWLCVHYLRRISFVRKII